MKGKEELGDINKVALFNPISKNTVNYTNKTGKQQRKTISKKLEEIRNDQNKPAAYIPELGRGCNETSRDFA